MPERLSDHDLDRELRRIAACLVAEAPPAPTRLPAGPVADTPVSAQRRRLGRYLPAFAAVTVVLIIVAGVVVGRGWFGSTGVDQASIGAADRRLILETWPGELLPDGSVVPLQTGDLLRTALTGAPQALPGGRYVVVSERYPSVDPAPSRADYLAVLDADGRVELERRVGTTTEWVGLLASTPHEAILIRARRDSLSGGIYGSYPSGQGRLVAHDLATGQERPLSVSVVPRSRTRTSVAADVIGDRLALAFPTGVREHRLGAQVSGSCLLEVIDLTSLGSTRVASLPNCDEVRGVQMSPSGQFVAVVFSNDYPELRFAMFDLEAKLARENILLGYNGVCEPVPPPCAGDSLLVGYLGMAWENNITARIALVNLRVEHEGGTYGRPIPRDAILVNTQTVR